MALAVRKIEPRSPPTRASNVQAQGQCVCAAVRFEIDVPARWAWHDHSLASRHAQGCAYATYVGSYRSRFRILNGEQSLKGFVDAELGTVRSFCGTCGTPLFYERSSSPTMINIPRALFTSRTGRETRYHMHMNQATEWTWRGEALAPLKGYPGVLWERPRKKKPLDPMFA